MIAFFGRSGWTLRNECVEAGAQPLVVVRVVGNAKTALASIAEHQMHMFGRFALRRGQQLRVVRQLDHEFWFGAQRQLGVGHFVAPRAEGRWLLDSKKKIGISHEGAVGQGGLEDDARALRHCVHGVGQVIGEIAFAGKFNQRAIARAQRGKIARFVGKAFVLDQFGLLVKRCTVERSIQIDQVQCSAMMALEEPGQIGCGIAGGVIALVHRVSWFFGMTQACVLARKHSIRSTGIRRNKDFRRKIENIFQIQHVRKCASTNVLMWKRRKTRCHHGLYAIYGRRVACTNGFGLALWVFSNSL